MKVVLTLPPEIHNLEIYSVTGMKAPPLGILSIASVLENAGHKVKVIDSPTLRLDFKSWLSEIKSFNPDIIGISMQTPMAPKGYQAVKIVKQEIQDIPVIAGGTHPSVLYNEALQNGYDIVVRGEGELTMLELTNYLERKGLDKTGLNDIAGIAFKSSSGDLIKTRDRPLIQNLDELPWPARHLVDMNNYTLFNKNINISHIMASRGCPYGCMYCITSYYWGRRFRYRSAENVVNEIEYLYNKYNSKTIVFTDDEFTANWKFVRDFITLIKSRGLDVSFSCGTRVDLINKDLMKLLYDNGCNALYFGVESASQDTLNKIGKRITIEQAKKAFSWAKELKGFTTGSFILGFPWETIDDMKNTVNFAIKLDPNYAQFTALTPYPGTPLYDYALKYNLITDNNWEHYTTVKPVMRGFNFTAQELGKMVMYAYRRFYVRWEFMSRELKAGRFFDLLGIIAKNLIFSTFESELKKVFEPLRWGK
ncbi:MAG: B12-binding domain-containing radical SAM protein [Caldisphaera sp.]|nr:MAG: B12-binding domain-containing radical SAM protein [Caldisphaera sp.]